MTLAYSKTFFIRENVNFFALDADKRILTLVEAQGAVNPTYEGRSIRLSTKAAEELRVDSYDRDRLVDPALDAYNAYVKSGKRVWVSKNFKADPEDQIQDLFPAIVDTGYLLEKHFPAGLSEEHFLYALDYAAAELVELDVATDAPTLYARYPKSAYCDYLSRTA